MPSTSTSTGPSLSLATATSSSVIAEAIQSALRCETSPDRAVTSPPPPRLTTRWPPSSRPNSAGPRLETIVRGWSGTPPFVSGSPRKLFERGEDPHPVEQQAGREEPLAAALLAGPPEPPAELGVLEDLRAALGCLVGRVDQVAVLAIDDLQRNAADVPGDRRSAFPEGLRHRQPEALADRLLQDDVGLGLKRVHLDCPDVVQVVEDLDVRVRSRVLEGAVEELPALGVVGRHRSDQRELHLGKLLGDPAIGVDHADRVLPGIEPRDLADHRAVDVDAELVADEGGVIGGEGHVLGRERVDRRRDDPDADVSVEALGHVLLEVPYGDVVLRDQREEPVDRLRVRLGEIDVEGPEPSLGGLRGGGGA